MKIGILIGSFNPFHLCHYKMAEWLIEAKDVDKVIIIPTNNNYSLKNNLVNYTHRYNMIKLVLDNDNIIISDLEKDKYNYTFENINMLKQKYCDDDLYLIIGADNLIELNTWKNYEEILMNCNFIIYDRNGINSYEYIHKNFANYKNKFIIKEDSNGISSTAIREKLYKKEDVSEYLDKRIIDYIKRNNLYMEVL